MKNVVIVLVFCVLVAFLIGDVVAVIHSTWFMFTHIHHTTMEAVFDPDYKVVAKLISILGTYITGKVLVAVCKD